MGIMTVVKRGLGTLCLLGIGYAMAMGVGFCRDRLEFRRRGQSRPFKASVWQTGDEQVSQHLARVRASMVDDIIQRKLLIGRAHWEVRDLLGMPDGDVRDGTVYVYRVDVGARMFGVWYHNLNVHFDADGKVSAVDLMD